MRRRVQIQSYDIFELFLEIVFLYESEMYGTEIDGTSFKSLFDGAAPRVGVENAG